MPKQYTVRCKELNPDGTGLVSFNNSNFSVAGVLPKEKCNIQLVYGKNETGARLTEIIEPSPLRTEVKCPAYGRCGGCSLLHMTYDGEISFKQEKVAKLFKGIAELPNDIIKSERPDNYRNKVYASFGLRKKGKSLEPIAGMYEENSRKVVDCRNCKIQNTTANKIIKTILDLMKSTGVKSYDPDTKTGVLRHVYLRVSEATGKVMLVLVTGIPEFKTKNLFVSGLTKKHPEIETIIHNINSKKTGMVLGDRSIILYGKGYIEDELLGCRFRISPESFYQVNPVQTEKLYRTALEFAGLTGTETVLDAYSGIGTISLAAAKSAKKVLAVEINNKAVSDAIVNASLNNIKNVDFISGDAGQYMTENCATLKPDVLFMDPPRSGSDEAFLKAVCLASPKKIVYISCNPETQARDVKFLLKNGYKAKKMTTVDMFSRTSEVENVILLEK